MIKRLLSISCIITALTAAAEESLETTFAGGFPTGTTLIDGDGCELQKSVYAHLGDTWQSWFVGKLGDGYGRAALSPTFGADTAVAADNWMIMPPVKVASSDAAVVWEARSLHKHIPESYKVMARAKGTDKWIPLYECSAEYHAWTHRYASLATFAGEEVEVAFVATTLQGFMLAIDNVIIGTMPSGRYNLSVEVLSPRFYGESDNAEVNIRIANYGDTQHFNNLKLIASDYESEPVEVGQIACGDTVEATFTINPPLNEKFEYTIVATNINDECLTLVESDWVYRSYFRRTSLIDRASGLWCNNCPPTELTITRLESLYGEQVIPVEAHVNDILANTDYRTQYLADFTYAIPLLVPNHRPEKLVYELKSTDDFSSALIEETIAGIEATCTSEGPKVTITSTVRFAHDIDNATDRYRIGYMLVADYHNPSLSGFVQSNQSSDYRTNQFYYMPNYIVPSLMYFDNVPVECAYATNGVAASLPESVKPQTAYTHTVTLNAPVDESITAIKAIAMVIDTADGHIVNAVWAHQGEVGAVVPIINDNNDDAWYTLQGVRLNGRPSVPGIYIHGGKAVKY